MTKVILLASLVIISCEDKNVDEISYNGQLEFSVNIRPDMLKSTETDIVNDINAVLISIENASGDEVYSLEKVELLNFGGDFITEPIPLKVGDYHLTDFVVVDASNNVLFATPKEGSPLEGSVSDALPVKFNIQKDQVVKLIPEVIFAGTAKPGDFGYSTFSFEIVETFDFLVSTFIYNLDSKNLELTEAAIKIFDNDKLIYSGELAEGTNILRLKDNIDEYRVLVDKNGYKSFQQTYTITELKSYAEKPLIITLKPYKLELVAKIAPYQGITPQWVEALIIPSKSSDKMVVATQSVGADCGGGSPVAVWTIDLDPVTGLGTNVEFKQSLSAIQNIRQIFFESSDNLLFTGSGWCGYKPPYYSQDNGETWKRADEGPVHPPNSTFSYTEFKNEIYAGTGYDPYHGQVYRWLGNGNWELKLDITDPPRTIVSSLVVFDNKLFVSANIYHEIKKGGIPVYVSDDGNSYAATSGISDDMGIYKMFADDNNLYAVAYHDNFYLYRWNGGSWEGPTPLTFSLARPHLLLAYNNNIYLSGKKDADTEYGIYISKDQGITWKKIVNYTSPEIWFMTLYNSAMYIGTKKDDNNNVHIYKLEL